MLQPVRVVRDPIRGGSNILVLCEVMHANGKPHETNHRAALRDVLDRGADRKMLGSALNKNTHSSVTKHLGWPSNGYPAPRDLSLFSWRIGRIRPNSLSRHTDACLDAGLLFFGTNAEVMPGQWEFQIGYVATKMRLSIHWYVPTTSGSHVGFFTVSPRKTSPYRSAQAS